jgi:putative membrane protein insertion efficiency factor
MGHCDSSTQLGRHDETFGGDGRSAEAASARESTGISAPAKSAATWWSLTSVQFYKIFLSPFFGGACKFYPSCSNYAYEAIARHGARRGIVLALKRLGRCRPFTQGGFDPVPDEDSAASQGPSLAVSFAGSLQTRDKK